jgi:hypothetical protein
MRSRLTGPTTSSSAPFAGGEPQYISREAGAGVTGRLEFRESGSDGQKRYGVEIICDEIDPVSPRSGATSATSRSRRL